MTARRGGPVRCRHLSLSLGNGFPHNFRLRPPPSSRCPFGLFSKNVSFFCPRSSSSSFLPPRPHNEIHIDSDNHVCLSCDQIIGLCLVPSPPCDPFFRGSPTCLRSIVVLDVCQGRPSGSHFGRMWRSQSWDGMVPCHPNVGRQVSFVLCCW